MAAPASRPGTKALAAAIPEQIAINSHRPAGGCIPEDTSGIFFHNTRVGKGFGCYYMSLPLMNSAPTYTENQELFACFYDLQGRFASCLAAKPGMLRAWLEALPPRDPEVREPSESVRTWRTARLSAARRRELHRLIVRAEGPGAESRTLAGWLLAAVPVRTFFEMAAVEASGARLSDPASDECHRRLLELRETLFLSNYGLAKAAAKRRSRQGYPEMLSAASDGLLDAIDRYVPGCQAARFAHFAGFWIRYHMARHFQKTGSLISFPVHQHRIARRIDRYLANRESCDTPPSADEVCRELQLGRAAYLWQQCRPKVVSLHGAEGPGAEPPAMELRLCDPAPEPDDHMEQAEIAARLHAMLRAHAGPATRVMLAFSHGIGGLAEAAEDYLAFLEEMALERLAGERARPQAEESGLLRKVT